MLTEAEKTIAVSRCWDKIDRAAQLLRDWVEARPFIYRGHCPYEYNIDCIIFALMPEALSLKC